MKILEPGVKPEPPKLWWIGQVLKCDHCNCLFELEESDGPLIKYELQRRINNPSLLMAKCPTCGVIVTKRE